MGFKGRKLRVEGLGLRFMGKDYWKMKWTLALFAGGLWGKHIWKLADMRGRFLGVSCIPPVNKPPPFKGLNIEIPIVIPI